MRASVDGFAVKLTAAENLGKDWNGEWELAFEKAIPKYLFAVGTPVAQRVDEVIYACRFDRFVLWHKQIGRFF
jgi:hypothetical protein